MNLKEIADVLGTKMVKADKNPLRIMFNGVNDPLMDRIRREARAEGYATTAGIKEFARIKYGARLNSTGYGFTSITFKDEKQYIWCKLGGSYVPEK